MTLITTLLLSFLIVLGAIGAMALGVLLGRGEIRGSCGGIAGNGCKICGKDTDHAGNEAARQSPVLTENRS